MSALPVEADASGRLDSTGAVVEGQGQVAEEGPSASFHRRGPRRPPPKPPPGIGCAGEARARTGPFNAVPCESSCVARLPTWICSTFGRRLAAGPFSSLSLERFSDRLVRARAVPSSPRVGRLAGKRLDNQRSVWRAPSRLQDVPVLNEQASPALGAQPERSGKSSSLTRVKPDGSRRRRPRGSRA